MSYLHYFFIVNFTLRIYQSYGFLPFPIRKLIEIHNTVMDTKRTVNENDITRTLPLPVIGIKRTVNENDITRTLSLPVIGITRTVNENDITRTLPLPVIGIMRTVHENDMTRTLPLPVIGIKRTLPQPSILKHDTVSLPIPKVTTDIGQNEKVTETSNTYYKTKGANFLKANRSNTASLLGIPGANKDFDSDEIGPIRVLIEDDTDFKPDYISFTKKLHKIAFFDITKTTVEDDESDDTPDYWFVVRRTSPYEGQYRVTRTSPNDGLYRVTRPSQMLTVYRVLADRRNFQSNEYNDMKPFRIRIDNDSNSDSEYNFESDFYEKGDISVSPSAFATKQDSWQEQLTWAYEEFPETEDDTSIPSSRTRQMTTSTQVSYGNESLPNENYSSYALNSTWLTFTIRNYFAQFVTTQRRSTARTDAIRRFGPALFTSSSSRSKNDKDVTKQIKHLTGAILYFRSRKIGRPKKNKARRLKPKPKRPRAVKDPWECYDCGMNETEYGQPDCSNIFENPNEIERHLRKNLTKKCNGSPKYHGQCFTRYLDVGNNYNERGCRSYPPATGRSYASQKFVRLEYLLKKVEDGCVTSPSAVLLPFNRGIQLYVHFHVCVCKGRKCNVATSIIFNWTTSLSIILYFVI